MSLILPQRGRLQQAAASTSISYQDSAGGAIADGTSVTYSGRTLGAANSNRYIVVGTYLFNSNQAVDVNSISVGGTSLSLVVEETTTQHMSVFAGSVPTGTTGDVVIGFSGTTSGYNLGWGLWRLIHSSGTEYDTDVSGSGTTVSLTGPADNSAVGIYIKGSINSTISSPSTTNITMTEEFNFDIRSNEYFYGGTLDSQTGTAITAGMTNVPGTIIGVIWAD